jgi:GNAT superfamily N-acetyltransferase
LDAIAVRPVRRSDFPAWKELWDGYNAFYGRAGATALDPEITEMTWSRFFDSYEPVHCVVAESSGRLVGLAHYLFHRSTTHLGSVCYLQDLFTAEESRGTGVGGALIEAVRTAALAAGARRLYWTTHETNTTAMRLYDRVSKKSGFIAYREELPASP